MKKTKCEILCSGSLVFVEGFLFFVVVVVVVFCGAVLNGYGKTERCDRYRREFHCFGAEAAQQEQSVSRHPLYAVRVRFLFSE